MKMLSLLVFLFFNFNCIAQYVPCFDKMPDPDQGTTDIIESDYSKTKITKFPTNVKPELATDTIMTYDPETEKTNIQIVQYDKSFQVLDKAEIYAGDTTYFYFKPPNADCFRIYKIKAIMRK